MKNLPFLIVVAAIVCLLFGGTLALASVEPASAPPADAMTHIGYAAITDDPSVTPDVRTANNVRLTSETVTDGRVVFPAELVTQIEQGLALAIAALVARLFNNKVKAEQLRDWTEAAVKAAYNYVPGANPDGTVSLAVGNAIVERALEYSIDLFRGRVAKFGGTEAQRQRIKQYIKLEPAAAFALPARLSPKAGPLPPTPARAETGASAPA